MGCARYHTLRDNTHIGLKSAIDCVDILFFLPVQLTLLTCQMVISEALAFIHSRGVLVRDVAPSFRAKLVYLSMRHAVDRNKTMLRTLEIGVN